VVISLAIIAVIAIALLQPYFEMRTFNKFSKQKATYIDAVFANLRVESSPEE
jgi:hypothetical protein